jgi:sigma-B regulation protein RsbU (phosphoserine phosphatase)
MQELMRQLQSIGELQRHLLPRQLPERDGYAFASYYRVGIWPGGDYYDFLSLPDGRLSLLIADASDQGAPSTALVAMVRVILHSCPLSSGREQLPFCPIREPVLQPPHILFGHLNRVLAENSLEEQYMTAFCGILDPFDGNFDYTSAGHPPPRWWRAAPRCVEPLQLPSGLPLGLDARATYHRKWIALEPGDLLVLHSDGLTAALSREAEQFGSARIDHILHRYGDQGARAVQQALSTAFEEFIGGQEPADDVTILVIERQRG